MEKSKIIWDGKQYEVLAVERDIVDSYATVEDGWVRHFPSTYLRLTVMPIEDENHNT